MSRYRETLLSVGEISWGDGESLPVSVKSIGVSGNPREMSENAECTARSEIAFPKTRGALPINPLTMLNCVSLPINFPLLPIHDTLVPIPNGKLSITASMLPIPSHSELAVTKHS